MVEPVLTLILLGALCGLAVIDAQTFRLPDWLTLPLAAAGLAAAWILGLPVWLHALGAVLGYAVLAGLELVYKRVRGRDGLGRGDAKLLAAGGAWCGALALPIILLVASTAGLLFVFALRLIGGRPVSGATRIAFGPFIALAIASAWILQRAGAGWMLGI